MRKRKLIVKNKRFRNSVLISLLVLFVFLGIGYASLRTTLNIGGSLKLLEFDDPYSLYNVLKREALNNGMAKEYTGDHHDSFTQEPSKKIYHWYGDGNIRNKHNVIFAGHCWRMIRTTDTGGVRLLYNGEVENDACLTNRGNHVGYSNNTIPPITISLIGTYYYGTSYEYDSASNKFSLSGDVESITVSNSNIEELFNTLRGKYTCIKTSETDTCSPLYLITNLNTSGVTVTKINSDANYSSIGRTYWDYKNTSPSFSGYMHNDVYTISKRKFSSNETPVDRSTYNKSTISNYWYGEDVIWDTTNNGYVLVNPQQITISNDYTVLDGKYTFLKNDINYTNNIVTYITNMDSSYIYYIDLLNGNYLNYYNEPYTYGDSYQDNGDGTYTILNPSTINRTEVIKNKSILKSKYFCKNAINDTCSDLRFYVGTYLIRYYYERVSNIIKYANDYDYVCNNGNCKYVLNDDSILVWDSANKNNSERLKTRHYTCFNSSGECSTLYFVITIDDTYALGDYNIFYISLQNGESVSTIIDKMLYDDNVNSQDSMIKLAVESWYEKYLIDYSDYLEDTIFCNNRNISSYNGWSKNNDIYVNSFLEFQEFDHAYSNLKCENVTDMFSIYNEKAKLKYKVGLPSLAEMVLFGEDSYAKYFGSNYWLSSPRGFFNNLDPFVNYNSISLYGSYADITDYMLYDTKPEISLRPGIRYTSGDGSMANPYVIQTN